MTLDSWRQHAGIVSQVRHDDGTFYNWKAKYGGLTRRLKAWEGENRRLKHIVADQALDIQALKAVVTKKLVKPRRNLK